MTKYPYITKPSAIRFDLCHEDYRKLITVIDLCASNLDAMRSATWLPISDKWIVILSFPDRLHLDEFLWRLEVI